MRLIDYVYVARRFQRSIRIDVDLRDPKALEGFICPRSSSDVLTAMARHVAETKQGAFTWTGPYGSGKSSLVVALAAALNGNANLRPRSRARSATRPRRPFGKRCRRSAWGGAFFPSSANAPRPATLSARR